MLFSDTPIIQAPMAGGITTPKFVSAVCQAGGIGSFGFAYSDAEKIAADLADAKRLTDGPINANFFIFKEPAALTNADYSAAVSALQALDAPPEMSWPLPTAPYYPNLQEQIEPVWSYKPKLLTFHFGLPPRWVLEKAKALGLYVGITATCPSEIRDITAFGADFVILQGVEAGGHRGTFEVDLDDEHLSTLELLQAAKSITALPLVTAGGIMTGQDIRTYLSSGASAVQLGTAFLCCEEAGTNAIYRHYLLHEQQRQTVFTKAFSGRWARAIETIFTQGMTGKTVLPFPIQNILTSKMRQQAAKVNNGEYQSLWAGSGFHKCRGLSVKALMDELRSELEP